MVNLTDVIIIGGGISGLSVAAELSNRNAQVVLLEASDYLGGRVKQVQPFQDCPLVDIGGEFIHGNETEALRLAKQYGWEYQQLDTELETDMCNTFQYTHANGQLCRVDDDNIEINRVRKFVDDFIAEGTDLRQKMNCSEKLVLKNMVDGQEDFDRETNADLSKCDCSLATFLSKSSEVDSAVVGLSDAFYCQSEGNDLNRIGMLEFSRAEHLWQYGTGNFRLKKTYRVFLEYLVDKCKSVNIKLNWQVKTVNWENTESISVQNQNGEILHAKHVVITVPLKILQDGDITFTPGLPSWKNEVLKIMEMRGAFKIFCNFSRKFWPSDLDVLYCAEGTPVKQIWIESDYDKNGKRIHMLCGFATASLAIQATKEAKEQLKSRFLNQLDSIFGKTDDAQPATDSFIDFFYYDWQTHPFIRGGYASPVVGSHAMSIQLSKPINNKLFFAGEATNFSSMSTVQAAFDSGIRAANEVLVSINNR